MLTTAHIDILRNILHHIDHLLLFIKLQPFLGEIAKANCITNVKAPTIRRRHPE